jgi:hypothetical protein
MGALCCVLPGGDLSGNHHSDPVAENGVYYLTENI